MKNPTLPLVLRGRRFAAADIRKIKNCAAEFYDFGRTRISIEICKALRWRQPNGWLKDRACRDVLRHLAAAKLVRLPRRRKKGHPGNKLRRKKKRFVFQRIALSDCVSLEFAKGNLAKSRWNDLVAREHYLGHKVSVGRCIKYLVSYKGVTAGAVVVDVARLSGRDVVGPKADLVEVASAVAVLRAVEYGRRRVRDEEVHRLPVDLDRCSVSHRFVT
jgi:hypothetical protein